MKKAIITGVTGQDGSYLADLLLAKGYEVHGIVRRTSTVKASRISHLTGELGSSLFLHYADLDDPQTLRRIIQKVSPDEFYHLAGQSHPGMSFEIPESTCRMTGMAVLSILEILRDLNFPVKFFHASSSEIFGSPKDTELANLSTAFRPSNPYGCAKALATNLVQVYRDSYQLFAVNGICFNHESPRRGENFLPKKVCKKVAEISCGLADNLFLGDIEAKRDWGYAPDYVLGMWLSLQYKTPQDFLFATGELHSVRELVEYASSLLRVDRDRVSCRDGLLRPEGSRILAGDSSKAKELLGWKPSISFYEMISLMLQFELDQLRSGQPLTS